MKTPEQITKLNFNDVAFFNEKTTTEAKWDMSPYLFEPSEIKKNTSKSGAPKITINDLVNKSDFETKIKSNSELEGKNRIDYVIEAYNKGVPLNTLRGYAENPVFVKALKFTGKNSILNDILNTDQLLKVQRTWLLSNVYMVKYWSKNCVDFIDRNDWAVGFLKVNNISSEEIQKQRERIYKKDKK